MGQHSLFWQPTYMAVARSLTLNLNSRLELLTQLCDPPRDILFADYNHEQRRQQRDCLFGHIGSTVVVVWRPTATARSWHAKEESRRRRRHTIGRIFYTQ